MSVVDGLAWNEEDGSAILLSLTTSRLDQFVNRTPPKQLPQYGLRLKRSCQVTHKQRY